MSLHKINMISTISFALLSLAALLHSSVSGAIAKRSADDSPQQCSYSFNVLANTGETCPSSAPSDVTLAEIQASLANLNIMLAGMKGLTNTSAESTEGHSSGDGGNTLTYKRWGRKECPDTATLLYEGKTSSFVLNYTKYSKLLHVRKRGTGDWYCENRVQEADLCARFKV